VKESAGLSRDDGKRPDGVTLLPSWAKGKPLAWDVTVPDTYADSHLADTATTAGCHHAQMSAWQGSALPRRLLHTGHRCCRQAASQVSHTATDGGFMTSAIHSWTPSFRCARPHGLELFAG